MSFLEKKKRCYRAAVEEDRAPGGGTGGDQRWQTIRIHVLPSVDVQGASS